MSSTVWVPGKERNKNWPCPPGTFSFGENITFKEADRYFLDTNL